MEATIRRKLSNAEAAEYLGLAQSTLNKLRCTGSGPVYIKAGSRCLYEISDLDAWTAERKRRHTSEPTN